MIPTSGSDADAEARKAEAETKNALVNFRKIFRRKTDYTKLRY